MARHAGDSAKSQLITGQKSRDQNTQGDKEPQGILSGHSPKRGAAMNYVARQAQLSAFYPLRRSSLSEHGATAVLPGFISFLFDPFLQVAGWNKIFFSPLRQLAEFPDRILLLALPDLCPLHGRLQNTDGLVIYFYRHRKGMTIFPSVGKSKTGRVPESCRSAMDDLTHQGQGLKSARAYSFQQEQFFEVRRNFLMRQP